MLFNLQNAIKIKDEYKKRLLGITISEHSNQVVTDLFVCVNGEQNKILYQISEGRMKYFEHNIIDNDIRNINYEVIVYGCDNDFNCISMELDKFLSKHNIDKTY